MNMSTRVWYVDRHAHTLQAYLCPDRTEMQVTTVYHRTNVMVWNCKLITSAVSTNVPTSVDDVFFSFLRNFNQYNAAKAALSLLELMSAICSQPFSANEIGACVCHVLLGKYVGLQQLGNNCPIVIVHLTSALSRHFSTSPPSSLSFSIFSFLSLSYSCFIYLFACFSSLPILPE